MKKLTRILSLMLVGLMIFGLTACGSDEANTNSDANTGKKYIISSDTSFAPFEFYDQETKTYIGVDMELLAAIAKDQGFQYEVKNEGFKPAMGSVQSGQSDAMIAGMSINDERKQTFDFSDGYFEDGSILVVGKDSAITSETQLQGKVVAAKIGTTSTTYAESVKDKYGFTISYYNDSPAMYQAVLSGNAVACFEDRSVIGWAIKENNIALKTVGNVLQPAYYGFAVKKGKNAELIEMFNKGLANIKANGTYDAILAKYGY